MTIDTKNTDIYITQLWMVERSILNKMFLLFYFLPEIKMYLFEDVIIKKFNTWY